jgi:hypothetical protein
MSSAGFVQRQTNDLTSGYPFDVILDFRFKRAKYIVRNRSDYTYSEP